MKQVLVIAICFLAFSITFGQTDTSQTLTSEHMSIEGTKISLIPPDGFVKATNFLGLQHKESGSTIMIIEIPGPFSQTSKGMTSEGLLSKGVQVKEIKQLTSNKLPAIFMEGEQQAYGNVYIKYILCFGTENETIVINGAVPEDQKEIATAVKASILASYYETGKKTNPFDVIDYSIDVTASKLQFASSVSNSLIFTADGIVPTESADKTTLIVGKSFSSRAIEDKKAFCLDRLRQFPVAIKKTKTVSKIVIDGISGYEIVAVGKDKKTGAEEKICQVLLFKDDIYYIFYGSTNQDFNSNIKEIKRVIRTFKRK